MKYQKEIDYILSLLKSAFNSTTAPYPPNELDWNMIFFIAKKHRIYTPMFFAMRTLPDYIRKTIPSYNVYELAYKKYLVTDANRNHYWSLLKSDFEDAGIDYLLLKGSVSKHLYPDTAMRMMRDIDILYRNGENNTLISIFEKYGFEVSKIEPKEISFKMDSLDLQMELQKYLVNEIYTDWFEYLNNIWDRCEKKSDHEYVMSDNDFYIYHIIHLAKHFKNGGIGIIHILDTYVLRKSYNLDNDYVRKELENLNLSQFESVILDLINLWFEGGVSSENLEDIAYYILNGGAFGSQTQRETNIAVNENNGVVSLRKRLFPSIEVIADYYGDFVKKHKWSLPFYWIKLNFQRLLRGKEKIHKDIKNFNNVSQERIDKTKRIFDYCGFK